MITTGLLDRHAGRRLGSEDRAPLADLMRLHHVPAVSAAVLVDGGEPRPEAHGTATGETVFQACSISKHVAAFGTLRLVEQGVLDLDEDVDAYLTSWRLPASDGWRPVVTVRQLLSHTAGLSYNWFRGFHQDDPVPTLRQVLDGEPPANTPPVRVSTLPGSRFRYSGSHYAVLQQLLEDVTGTPFTDLLRTLVLDPLGMADSSYDQAFPHQRPAAVGHHVDGEPLSGKWRVQPELAGAGLWTTPTDLVRLGAEVLRASTGRSALLTEHTAADMLTPQVPGGYGLGVQVTADRFGHTGGNIGYSCWLFTWPGTATTAAVMTNNAGADEVLVSLLDEADRRYTAVEAEGRPTGVYLVRDDYAIEITDTDGHLALHTPNQVPVPLRPLAPGRYRAAGLDCEIRVTGPDTVELRQESDTTTAIRRVLTSGTPPPAGSAKG
ncbi:MAG: serine hydrolase domain-containing protein [Umezawaea sp.]